MSPPSSFPSQLNAHRAHYDPRMPSETQNSSGMSNTIIKAMVVGIGTLVSIVSFIFLPIASALLTTGIVTLLTGGALHFLPRFYPSPSHPAHHAPMYPQPARSAPWIQKMITWITTPASYSSPTTPFYPNSTRQQNGYHQHAPSAPQPTVRSGRGPFQPRPPIYQGGSVGVGSGHFQPRMPSYGGGAVAEGGSVGVGSGHFPPDPIGAEGHVRVGSGAHIPSTSASGEYIQ